MSTVPGGWFAVLTNGRTKIDNWPEVRLSVGFVVDSSRGQQKGHSLGVAIDLRLLWWRGFQAITHPSGWKPEGRSRISLPICGILNL
jgi:hypothetical protein